MRLTLKDVLDKNEGKVIEILKWNKRKMSFGWADRSERWDGGGGNGGGKKPERSRKLNYREFEKRAAEWAAELKVQKKKIQNSFPQ